MGNPILEMARELGPSIAARSAEIESLGTLPLDVVDAIRPSQAFRQYVPADLGGPSATAWEGLEVIEEYAYHDGSTGWCVAISCTSWVGPIVFGVYGCDIRFLHPFAEFALSDTQ